MWEIKVRIFVILFFIVNLTACVTMSVPGYINSPTALGEGVLNVSGIVANEQQIIFSSDTETPPVLEYEHSFELSTMYFKIGYGITDRMDTELLFGSHFGSFDIEGDKHLSLSLSYQWLGASIYKTKQGDLNSTAKLQLIRQNESFDNEFVVGSGFYLSNSFGYMISNWFSFYGGGRAIYILANYEIKEEDNNRTINNHLWCFGPFVGVQLNTIGSVWKIIFAVEGNFTDMPISAGFYELDKNYWIPGYSSSLRVLYQL